jgi:hypothetical protein
MSFKTSFTREVFIDFQVHCGDGLNDTFKDKTEY